MGWLMCGDHVLATVEVADSVGARLKGLLGRSGIEGALLIRGARSVHTFGMRFPVDVAFCDADLVVVDVVHMEPHRVGRPRLKARAVVEAEAGAFERWGLHVGDQLEVKR